jgi:predicted nucleotidyltransferase
MPGGVEVAEKTVLNIVHFLGKCLERNGVNASRIIVFGSSATGAVRKDGDIDLVIVSEDFRGKSILERIKMTGQPEVQTIRKFMVPLDIITMTPEELESETSPVAGYARQGRVMFPAGAVPGKLKHAAAR